MIPKNPISEQRVSLSNSAWSNTWGDRQRTYIFDRILDWRTRYEPGFTAMIFTLTDIVRFSRPMSTTTPFLEGESKMPSMWRWTWPPLSQSLLRLDWFTQQPNGLADHTHWYFSFNWSSFTGPVISKHWFRLPRRSSPIKLTKAGDQTNRRGTIKSVTSKTKRLSSVFETGLSP